MRVGISYWGVTYDFQMHRHVSLDTPDGHRYGRPLLIRELLERGHTVVALQQRREEQPGFFASSQHGDNRMLYCSDNDWYDDAVDSFRACRFPDLDVIFMEWRWPTWKNDPTHPNHDPTRHEPDLDRQLELIDHYRGRTPIIAWDTDLKMTQDDEARFPELILADPSLRTNRLTRDRVSLPFWSDWDELLPVAEPYPIYGYVGNNYERPDEFQRFYFAPRADIRKLGVQTAMYGNWLQRSPEREAPESLIRRYPEVAFNHRMDFHGSMSMMNRFVCTTHVSKQSYYDTGFVSPRYLEAVAVNCPALAPEAMRGIVPFDDEWFVGDEVDVMDAVATMASMSLEHRRELVAKQRSALRGTGMFDVSRVADFIESSAMG